jgi:inorganic pyrophosphatase
MSFSQITLGEDAPQLINAVIEIPKGSHCKYEYDEDLDEIRLDRVLHSPVYYPADYGFIPHTRAEDGDHLDVLVILSDPLFPGCVVKVKPIGLLDMEDEGGRDCKIIAVAQGDPNNKNLNDVSDIEEHFKKEVQHFFEVYKKLENKWVKIRNWHNKSKALDVIRSAQKRFEDEQT